MGEMSPFTIYVFWAAAIIVFGVLEAATAQLVSIWFVIGAIASLISAFFGATLIVQIIIFVVTSVLALVITRPLVRKYINPKIQHTNADKVIDQIGLVVEDINNIESAGQVKVDGKIWTARAIDNSLIARGSEVIIRKIEGVKLIVEKLN